MAGTIKKILDAGRGVAVRALKSGVVQRLLPEGVKDRISGVTGQVRAKVEEVIGDQVDQDNRDRFATVKVFNLPAKPFRFEEGDLHDKDIGKAESLLEMMNSTTDRVLYMKFINDFFKEVNKEGFDFNYVTQLTKKVKVIKDYALKEGLKKLCLSKLLNGTVVDDFVVVSLLLQLGELENEYESKLETSLKRTLVLPPANFDLIGWYYSLLKDEKLDEVLAKFRNYIVENWHELVSKVQPMYLLKTLDVIKGEIEPVVFSKLLMRIIERIGALGFKDDLNRYAEFLVLDVYPKLTNDADKLDLLKRFSNAFSLEICTKDWYKFLFSIKTENVGLTMFLLDQFVKLKKIKIPNQVFLKGMSKLDAEKMEIINDFKQDIAVGQAVSWKDFNNRLNEDENYRKKNQEILEFRSTNIEYDSEPMKNLDSAVLDSWNNLLKFNNQDLISYDQLRAQQIELGFNYLRKSQVGRKVGETIGHSPWRFDRKVNNIMTEVFDFNTLDPVLAFRRLSELSNFSDEWKLYFADYLIKYDLNLILAKEILQNLQLSGEKLSLKNTLLKQLDAGSNLGNYWQKYFGHQDLNLSNGNFEINDYLSFLELYTLSGATMYKFESLREDDKRRQYDNLMEITGKVIDYCVENRMLIQAKRLITALLRIHAANYVYDKDKVLVRIDGLKKKFSATLTNEKSFIELIDNEYAALKSKLEKMSAVSEKLVVPDIKEVEDYFNAKNSTVKFDDLGLNDKFRVVVNYFVEYLGRNMYAEDGVTNLFPKDKAKILNQLLAQVDNDYLAKMPEDVKSFWSNYLYTNGKFVFNTSVLNPANPDGVTGLFAAINVPEESDRVALRSGFSDFFNRMKSGFNGFVNKHLIVPDILKYKRQLTIGSRSLAGLVALSGVVALASYDLNPEMQKDTRSAVVSVDAGDEANDDGDVKSDDSVTVPDDTKTRQANEQNAADVAFTMEDAPSSTYQIAKGDGFEMGFRKVYGLTDRAEFKNFLVRLAESNGDKTGVSGYQHFLAGLKLADADVFGVDGKTVVHPGDSVEVSSQLFAALTADGDEWLCTNVDFFICY